jgi:phospholipase C
VAHLSPWRQSISGDLTSTLDLRRAEVTFPALPDIQNQPREPYPVPAQQSPPAQDPGTRPRR